MTTDTDRLLSLARRMTTPERQPEPGEVWKCGDQFLPFHPQASHIPPDYRDGWNRCYFMAMARDERIRQDERERLMRLFDACLPDIVGMVLAGARYDDEEISRFTPGIVRDLYELKSIAAIRSSGTSKSEGDING